MTIFSLLQQTVDVLPAPDPLPLPAAPWIFFFLMYLVFVLHMLAMNFTVGGTLIQVYSGFSKSEKMKKFSLFLSKALPITMSFTVTLGIAPLLFVQVLYGQIFFTTSVLMGWIWLGMLALLMIAYYSLYYFQYNHQKSELARKGTPLLALVLLLVIMVIFIMNFKLFFMSEQWEEIYRESNSMYVNLGHPQVLPTILHYITAVIAFGGLLMVMHGWSKKKSDPEYAGWAARVGGLTFAIPTALQFLFGTLLLMSLPREMIRDFMMGNTYATTMLFAGMTLALLAIICMIIVAVKRVFGVMAFLGVTFSVLILAAMTLVRGYVRDVMAFNLVDPGTFAVQPQWINMVLFAVLLVVGLGIVGWMLVKVALGEKNPDAMTDY